MIILENPANWCHIIRRMRGKTIAIAAAVLLAVRLLGPAALGAAPQGFSTGLRAGGGIELAGSDPFPVKAQGAGSGGLYAELQLNRWLGLGLAAQAHFTAPSSLSGGFQYRGHWGADLRPYLSVRWTEHSASENLELVAGNLVGAIARYDGYLQTFRYFFYMGIYVEPYLELHFPGGAGGRHSLVTSMPLDLYFRRDLPLSAAAGLAVAWKLYLRRPPTGGGP